MNLNNLNLNKEDRLLVLLSRITLTDIDEMLVIKNLTDEINWSNFINEISKHSVYSIVLHNLKKICSKYKMIELFAQIEKVANFKKVELFLKLKDELYLKELELLSKNFEENDIKVVLLKGMIINKLIYNKKHRDYSDIDLLIKSNDIVILHKILTKLGYIAMYDNNIVDLNDIITISKNSIKQICDYKKKNFITFSIDIHNADNEFEFLNDIYDSAIQIENNLYSPTLFDIFIYACQHAWRHYPFLFRMVNQNSFLQLKDLMDIRESYLQIYNEGKEEDLFKRVNNLDALYIVNEMLYLTSRIYGSFSKKNYQANVNHDYYSDSFKSTFESRLFRPQNEQMKAIELNNNYINNNSNIILCTKVNCSKNISNIEFWENIKKYKILSSQYYRNEYGYSNLNNNNQEAEFSLAYNNDYFLIRTIIYDNSYILGKNEYYEPYKHQINLIFNDNWNEHLTIQVKENHKSKVFIEHINVINISEIPNSIIYDNIYLWGYSVIAKIPWKFTKIESHKDIFKIHICIIVGNPKHLNFQLLSSEYISPYVKLI